MCNMWSGPGMTGQNYARGACSFGSNYNLNLHFTIYKLISLLIVKKTRFNLRIGEDKMNASQCVLGTLRFRAHYFFPNEGRHQNSFVASSDFLQRMTNVRW